MASLHNRRLCVTKTNCVRWSCESCAVEEPNIDDMLPLCKHTTQQKNSDAGNIHCKVVRNIGVCKHIERNEGKKACGREQTHTRSQNSTTNVQQGVAGRQQQQLPFPSGEHERSNTITEKPTNEDNRDKASQYNQNMAKTLSERLGNIHCIGTQTSSRKHQSYHTSRNFGRLAQAYRRSSCL